MAGKEFISINNTILDYDEYVKTVILLKNFLKNKVKELLFKEGFVLTTNKNLRYDKTDLTLYNKELDVEITLKLKKKNKEVFV